MTEQNQDSINTKFEHINDYTKIEKYEINPEDRKMHVDQGSDGSQGIKTSSNTNSDTQEVPVETNNDMNDAPGSASGSITDLNVSIESVEAVPPGNNNKDNGSATLKDDEDIEELGNFNNQKDDPEEVHSHSDATANEPRDVHESKNADPVLLEPITPKKSQQFSDEKVETAEAELSPKADQQTQVNEIYEEYADIAKEESPVSGRLAQPSGELKLTDDDQQLKLETAKVENAIEKLKVPPLPSRSHVVTSPTVGTPPKTPDYGIESSPATSQSAISPPLPPRNHDKRKQYGVPPPFDEEMRSEIFRKNLAMTNEQPPVPPRSHTVAHAKRLDSAAEINLIANRLRQTSHHYQEENKASREYLDEGKNMLQMSYSTFLESLPPTPLLGKETIQENEEEGDTGEHEKPFMIDWEFWTRVVNDFASVASEPELLEEKVTDGIPAPIRGIIWQLVANSKSKEFEDIYETLSDTKSPHEANIRRDLRRTKYLPEDKMESLLKILTVYSVYDPDVGYTQGMAFIATPLILNCQTPAEALGLLIRLMKFYALRELFLPEMPGLMILLYQFDRLLEEGSPQLYNHLTRQGVRSSMYATQWFLTFFAYKFPLGFVLRIFDIVFVEGVESILRFAVNLMLKNSESLLALNFDKLLDYLKNELFNYYLKESIEARNRYSASRAEINSGGSDTGSVLKKEISSSSQTNPNATEPPINISDDDYDIELFVHEAMHDVHVTPISLKRYTAEYDEIHQIEQQKEAQYSSIKIKNLQLQKEVRKLEHDYTLLNKEHVEIANELIKNRLRIETLLDENSDQKLIILELKKHLDEEIRKQTFPNPDATLPSDLRVDLDRTIKRNAEVMSENAKLQDKITEQEKIIFELKNGNSGDYQMSASSLKPPLANGWSGFKKVFK